MAEILSLLAQFGPLISQIIDAIQRGGMTEEKLLKFLEDSATAASDAEMNREFPTK